MQEVFAFLKFYLIPIFLILFKIFLNQEEVNFHFNLYFIIYFIDIILITLVMINQILINIHLVH